jgi:hypothetical protein
MTSVTRLDGARFEIMIAGSGDFDFRELAHR